MTCGDIGSGSQEVERNMEHHFNLAHKWGCVLLLDEADDVFLARRDVFLARRDVSVSRILRRPCATTAQQKAIHCNGLVSIFLHILEYCSDILFLTTNWVGTVDDAFRSRLQLTLYYPSLRKD
ncbi:hypothetical protein QBC36DRAFT_125137 [Triangularia setosa]|uniref:ATPase AAA-type core domain-containing protein n=1 Tax=Triangularia setosa TaxID=2587417 RepID=A0AAN6W9F0_9PEZI|nr:hypothetical protein QBC36DRAFT_125137 [Podospora setosa]